MDNINSFTEVTNNLVKSVNIALQSLVSLNTSMTTQEDSVPISIEGSDPISGEASTYTYTIPSYTYTTNKLDTLNNTVDVLTKGQGKILLSDGTYREVKTIPVAIAPSKITSVSTPTTFTTRNNWFFESMMFPQLIVSFDLKDKIDDRSDRIVVKRVIFDNFNDTETSWFITNFVGQTYTYYDAITLLNKNNKKYWEDDDTIDLPLAQNLYTGDFYITDKQLINGSSWYFLDTLNYGLTSDEPIINSYQLKIGDELRYGENSVFIIKDIVITENRVQLTSKIGLSNPTIGSSFEIYNEPFKSKIANIAIGYDECNILFIKGVNDDYNLISNDWSDSISFYSNNLILKDATTTLQTYYNNYIADFGRQLEGQAKEKFVPAYYGLIPDAPNITSSQFEVKQINTQLNATLDKNSIISLQSNIVSNKALINNLQQTIASQKSNLIELTDQASRSSLQAQINNNINNLSNLVIQYQSDVDTLTTMAYENNAVISNPIYKIQGFFEIPASKIPKNQPDATPQQVIQFDIAYRYLRLDGTGNPLNTYSYTDPSTNQTISGTFTDWQIVQSPIKQKVYNENLGLYEWADENIQDGQTLNINQVSISIQKGEKVQLKIRSISEAGWPVNPLKSEWSNAVTIDFPANLQNSDQISTILVNSKSEQTAIQLQKTMDAAGVTSHLSDTIPNPNSANGIYYKHEASSVAYNLSIKDTSTGLTSTISTTDVQTVLDNLSNNFYVTLSAPTGYTGQKTVKLQTLFQQIINVDPSVWSRI